MSVGERWIDAVEVRRHVAARRSMRGSRDLAIYVRRGVPAMTGERPPRDRGTGR
ncbi:histidine kinase [Burkholderia thailandensis]|nr:histidine kinase [Burkholderia thailandensis]AOI54356.1 histidine kinase [Burkholderia thailandensis]AOJ53340.1 histidine kinase [Burkholderia thailandensis]AOJ59281.1 histidine kinase [Burkholderia thailandensis]KXF58402.1 histidine kinase [Burkholderia thailandensis]